MLAHCVLQFVNSRESVESRDIPQSMHTLWPIPINPVFEASSVDNRIVIISFFHACLYFQDTERNHNSVFLLTHSCVRSVVHFSIICVLLS